MPGPLPHRTLMLLAHPDPPTWRARAREIGFDVPEPVFTQLFGATSADPLRQQRLVRIDWAGVRFREAELSGDALAQVQVARELEHAVEEARQRVLVDGLAYYESGEDTADEARADDRADDRAEALAILASWRERGTWLSAPVLVGGDVLDLRVSFSLLTGFTRLGELLGQIERGDVPRERRHRVWVGERA